MIDPNEEVPKIAKPVETPVAPQRQQVSEQDVPIEWHPTLESFLGAVLQGPDFKMTPEQLAEAKRQLVLRAATKQPPVSSQDSPNPHH